MCLCERVVGVLVEKIGAEYGEGGTVLLPFQHLMSVLEFVVTNRHGVITHRNHEFKRQFSLGQLGQCTGENITGIEQEYIGFGQT